MASTSTSGRGEQAPDPFSVLEPPNKKIKSSLSVKQFDVFINHRGPDVKTTLAWQLYNSLKNAGISAYLDSEETELGDYFPSAIKNAIFSARVHIAILSPRYAESAWCLAELALMFQTKARIIPLFYHVQPSDFRYIKYGVADAFSIHEEKSRYPNYDIQEWKECLKNVAGIKGYELNGQNDYLNKLCCDVVTTVVKEKKKRKIPLQVAKYEVGLDELVKDFQSHCQSNGEMKDKIIGIFGMGGSGKTTLAKYLFNRKSSEFSGSTFLFDVRDFDVKGMLTSLQNKLQNDLFPRNHQSFSSVEDGIAAIQDNLQRNREFSSIEDGIAVIKDNLQRSRDSRFLIVIDDADHQKQLDALVPIHALNPKSLVIVTTRDQRLLIEAGVNVRYKMKQMNPEHSRELFCWHAFQKQSSKSGFQNLVDGFVEVCQGLPLALRVMGGHVFGSDKSYWKLQLDVVKKKLHKDIKDTLKVSYDALEEDEKQIFMDIACFFIGKEASMAMSIWKASGWRAEHALQTLKDKCLVDLQPMSLGWDYCDPEFVLRMHDHLRDLGRDMADNEMSNSCRLWRPTDLIEMENIVKEEGKNFRYFNETATYMTYLLEISKTSTDLQWLQFRLNWGYEYIPEWIPLQNLHTFKTSRSIICEIVADG
ncbi:disease resistance protein Roq1-like [Cryptomeria japonica]|uniref:disease resistance protein Roq1-like n=1 Tax=Cryptomeria japonica TaxID=3369 RepID=UPI0027DA1B8E|nr:disease resistance protein Roq1-like [Cryptomeria japonica]